MKKFWYQTYADFQAPQCLRCHSLNVSNMYLCKACEDHIDSKFLRPKIHQMTSEISVQSFYQWRPDESDTLSDIALLLKSKYSKWVWFQIVEKLIKTWDMQPHYFVPIPGHNKDGMHSIYFSQALSEYFKGCHVDLITSLKRLDPGNLKEASAARQHIKQQRLSRAERQQSNIQIHVDFTELNRLPSQSKITLVDDIVTTGFTIQKTAAIIRELRPDLKLDSVALFNRTRTNEVSDWF